LSGRRRFDESGSFAAMKEAVAEGETGAKLAQLLFEKRKFGFSVDCRAEYPRPAGHVAGLPRKANGRDAGFCQRGNLAEQVETGVRHCLHAVHGKEALAVERVDGKAVRVLLADEAAIILRQIVQTRMIAASGNRQRNAAER